MISTIEARLNFTLHQNQKRIHECGAKYRVIKAGKRFGKTRWALFEICQAAGLTRNGTFWYIAPTYKQAKSIAWHELKWMLPPQFVTRRVENELLIELTSGSTIQLIGADNEDALRGPKLHGVIFDEAAYIDEYVWPNIIRGQLLGSEGAETGFAYFISSPNKKGRNWFTGFHADAERKEKQGDREWGAFYFTIYDNPTLDPDEIKKIQDDNTEDQWNLEYMALESSLAGQLFSEFSLEKNVGEPASVKGHLFYRGIDWGIDHPTVCLWAALDPMAKVVYITDEFVRSDLVISELADMIKVRTGDKEIEWTVIDPSTAKRNSQVKHSTDALEFRRCGIPVVMADNRARGYDITKMFLKKERLMISPKCKNLIYALKHVQYSDDENDDTTDVLRYLCLKIHDSISGMNIYEIEVPATARRLPGMPAPREFNLYDPMFNEPKPDQSIQAWLIEETAA